MAVGRPPKPTHMKLLEGNPGKRALPAKEPKPPRKIPTCPRHLDKPARAEWRRITKLLDSLGMISELDRATLAVYCQTWSDLMQLEEYLKTIPVSKRVFRTAAGYYQQIPQVGMVNKLRSELRAYITEFGLSPAARTRIQVEKPEKVENPFEVILQRAKANASG